MKKILLSLLLFFMAFSIDALSYTTYDNSITTVNNYINKYSDRNKYLIFNTKYDFNNTSPIVNNSFTHGGLLSKKEFETTIVNDRSYLSNGREYWTITPVTSSNLQYYVDASLLSKSRGENSGIRVTEFIKKEVKVDGIGTFVNPWVFRKEFSIHVKSESSEYGNITSGADQMVASGKTSSEIIVNEKAGYVYASDDCGLSKKRNIDNFNTGYEIKNVTRDIDCVVHFKVREISINYNCNGGTGSTPSQTVKYGTSYTLNTSGCTRKGYTQTGWVSEERNVSYSLGQSGTWGYTNGEGGVVSNKLKLNAVWKIDNPETPTVGSSAATKVYNRSKIRVTCSTTTEYDTGVTPSYSFGYSTTDGGTPSNWVSTNATDYYDVPYNRETRYYSCRLSVSDATQTSSTVTSNNTDDLKTMYVNARIDFDATTNGGTLDGTTPLYVSYKDANVYTTRTGSTTSSIPTATKKGYTFTGWYTDSSSGSLVINANKSIVSDISSWTNASGQWIKTSTSNNAGTSILYAQFGVNSYSIEYSCGSGSGTAPTTQTVEFGGSVSVASGPGGCTKKGYHLKNWSSPGADGSGTSTWTLGWTTNNWSYADGEYGITNKKLTLTAVWEKNTYTIEYNCGSGSGTAPTSQQVTYAGSVTLASTGGSCTKGGYHVSKWSSVGESGSGTANWDLGKSISNWSYDNGQYGISNLKLTLTAVWEANTYTVKFNCNGGSGAPANQTATYNSAFTITSSTCTTAPTGYYQDGWNEKTDGSGTNWNTANTNNWTWNRTADVTLYAKWVLKSTQLTIKPNGGKWNNSTSDSSVTQNYNTTYKVANNATKTGYTFKGFSFSGTGSYNIYDSSATASDTTTVDYNASNSTKPTPYNNNSNGTVTNSMVSDSSASGGYTLKVVTNGSAKPNAGGIYLSIFPTKPGRINVLQVKAKIPTGYKLAIHAISAHYTGMGSGYVASDLSGTGAWKTYTFIVYTGTTGSFSSNAYLTVNGSDNTSVTWYVDQIVMKSYTNTNFRTIYTFGDGGATLTASYEASGAKVTFNTNGGAFDTNNVKSWSNGYYNASSTKADRYVNYLSAYATYPGDSSYNWIPATNVTSKTGYSLKGWYTATTNGTQVFNSNGTLKASVSGYSDANQKWIKYDENVDLYAQWQANTYTVSFDPNGGSGGQSTNVTATYDAAMPTISTTKPTRSGFEFMGWYDNKTYTSGTQYYTAAGASARTYNKTSNTTLYAGWRETTKPTVKVTAYKYNDSADNNVGTLVKAEETFTANGSYEVTASSDLSKWVNYGVTFKVVTSDGSGIASRTLKYNGTGAKSDPADSALTKTATYDDNTSYPYFTGEGFRKAKLTVTDNAGNSITITLVVKIDKTKPYYDTGLTYKLSDPGPDWNNYWIMVMSDDYSGVGKWRIRTGGCTGTTLDTCYWAGYSPSEEGKYHTTTYEYPDAFDGTNPSVKCTSVDTCHFYHWKAYMATKGRSVHWNMTEVCDRAGNCLKDTTTDYLLND